jgi:sec-independent protein translocase protein TatB
MFDVSWGKLVIIGVVALIVIGPKELPAVLRTIGQWMGKIRRMAGEFQGQFQEAMREAEMADLKKQFDETTSSLNSVLDPSTIASDMQKMVDEPVKTDQTVATSTPATPPDGVTDPATNDAAPADPVALGTEPVAPKIDVPIDVPLPDLPPPVETKDFASAPVAEPSAPAATTDAPVTPKTGGGKAA